MAWREQVLKWAGAGVVTLLWIALQVSGVQNLPLAAALAIVALMWWVWSILTTQRAQHWLRSRPRLSVVATHPGLVTVSIASLILNMILGVVFVRGPRVVFVERAISTLEQSAPVLSPEQARLLCLVYKYQVEFADYQVLIGRDGFAYRVLDEKAQRGPNITAKFYGSVPTDERLQQFRRLVDQMPSLYLQRFPSTRLGDPALVGITQQGIEYLRSGQLIGRC